MPVALINGYVVLPDPPDWSTPPTWARAWETGVTTAITGDERRQGVRNLGRETLSWVISALSLEQRAELDQRLDAASKTGLACAPFWGRASTLSAPVSGTAVALTDSVWTFAPGDYVYFEDPFGNYETAHILSVGPIVLTGAVSRTYPTGSQMWPMLFGKFAAPKQTAVTSWHGDVKVTLAELNARHQLVIGTPPSGPGTGVGSDAVGSTLTIG